jgi:hypothetical protein
MRRGVAVRGDRWRPVTKPDVAEAAFRYQVSDIASSVYRDRFGCWGFLDLWRTQPAPPFPAADVEFLGRIAGPLTAALRHSQAKTFAPSSAGPQLPAGPVVLLLSPALDVRAQTAQTQLYLRVLLPPGAKIRHPSPPAPTTSPRNCSPPKPVLTTAPARPGAPGGQPVADLARSPDGHHTASTRA